MERLEDLLIDNYKIYQDDELYCFTSDAVLLSKFASVKYNDIVADFCAGSGIVGLHLFCSHKNVKSVTLFEMQKELFELSVKSVKYNNLEDKFTCINTKLQDINSEFYGKFSLIVCNPPYMEKNTGEINEKECIAVCKREITLSLEELISVAEKCLKYGGRFAMCFRADRVCDVIYLMKNKKIEPKKIQFVSAKNKEPYLVLIEGVKGGKSSVKILPTAIN